MLKKALMLLFILLLSSVSLSFAQDDVTAVTLVDLNMRNAPRAGAEVIMKLPAQTTVVVEGRDSTQTWLLVHTQDGTARGWMAIQYLRLDQAISIRNLTDMSGVDLSIPPRRVNRGSRTRRSSRRSAPTIRRSGWAMRCCATPARFMRAVSSAATTPIADQDWREQHGRNGLHVYLQLRQLRSRPLYRSSASRGSLQFDRLVLPLRLHGAQRLGLRQSARSAVGD